MFLIRWLFWSSLLSVLCLVGFWVGGAMYFRKVNPQGYELYKETVRRDMRFSEDWMWQFAEDGNQRRCKLLGLPIGYRCFYYETFREIELRELTVPGIVSFWQKGYQLIWNGDPELAKQPYSASGVPAENQKLQQFWHWTKFMLRELERSLRNSPLVAEVLGRNSQTDEIDGNKVHE